MVRGKLPGHLNPRHKVSTRWNGPYEVVGATTPFTRDIRLIGSQDEGTTVHLQRITRFAGADLEKTVELVESAQHDALQYEVEEILDVRVKEGKVQLLISWLGFTEEDDSWEPAVDMFDYVPKMVLAALQDADPNPVVEDLLLELRED